MFTGGTIWNLTHGHVKTNHPLGSGLRTCGSWAECSWRSSSSPSTLTRRIPSKQPGGQTRPRERCSTASREGQQRPASDNGGPHINMYIIYIYIGSLVPKGDGSQTGVLLNFRVDGLRSVVGLCSLLCLLLCLVVLIFSASLGSLCCRASPGQALPCLSGNRSRWVSGLDPGHLLSLLATYLVQWQFPNFTH